MGFIHVRNVMYVRNSQMIKQHNKTPKQFTTPRSLQVSFILEKKKVLQKILTKWTSECIQELERRQCGCVSSHAPPLPRGCLLQWRGLYPDLRSCNVSALRMSLHSPCLRPQLYHFLRLFLSSVETAPYFVHLFCYKHRCCMHPPPVSSARICPREAENGPSQGMQTASQVPTGLKVTATVYRSRGRSCDHADVSSYEHSMVADKRLRALRCNGPTTVLPHFLSTPESASFQVFLRINKCLFQLGFFFSL